MYTLMAVPFLWLFQCATFFWGVVWPYHYSVAKSSGRLKYHHISAVLASTVLPLIVVVIAQFNGGYGLILPLSPRCGVVSTEALFYGFVLPLDLIITVGILLLVLTLWNVANMVSSKQ